MDASSTDDTEPEVIDDVDGTARSEAVLNQDLSHTDQTHTPEVNTFTPSDVVLFSQNEQMFAQSDMSLNGLRNLSRCLEQLKKLAVKIVVTRTETATDDSRTETREVIHQGSGRLLTRHSRRIIPEDFLTQEGHVLGSLESFADFKLYVQTTRDLINDDIDAVNSTVSIYNINGDGEDVLSIRGHHVYHSAIPGDRTVTLICQGVTREIAEIVERLKDDFFHSIQQIPEEDKRRLVNKAIMVNCPHGRGQGVSVGDFKEVKYLEYRSRNGGMRFKRVNTTEASQNQGRLWRGLIHNLPTCEVLNGAPIITFKYDGDVVVYEMWIQDDVGLEPRVTGTILKLCTQEDTKRTVIANRNQHAPESREHNSLMDPPSVVSSLPVHTAAHQVTPQAFQRSRRSNSLMSCVQLREDGIASSFQTSPLLTSTMNQGRAPAETYKCGCYICNAKGDCCLDQIRRETTIIQSVIRPKATRKKVKQDLTTGQSNGHLYEFVLQDFMMAFQENVYMESQRSMNNLIVRGEETRRRENISMETRHSVRGQYNFGFNLSKQKIKQDLTTDNNVRGLNSQVTLNGRSEEEDYNIQRPHIVVQATSQGYRGRHEIITSASLTSWLFYLKYRHTQETVVLSPFVSKANISVMNVYPTILSSRREMSE